MKKLVKQKEPVFMAIVWAKKRDEPCVIAAAVSASQGLTKKKKRLIMKEVGPKKTFITVEEREKEVLSGVAPKQRDKLWEIIQEYLDVSLVHYQRNVPQKGTLFMKLTLNLALNQSTDIHIG